MNQHTRKVHDFPNTISINRVSCPGGFFTPSYAEVGSKQSALIDYFHSPTVGLLLPFGSKREQDSFPKTLNYVLELGITPERIIVVYSPRVQTLVNDLGLKEKGYLLLNEATLLELFDTDRIQSRFGVEITKQTGKGSAFSMAFAYLHYVSGWDTLKDLFFLDVDANATQFQPLHYLGYAQTCFPEDRRLFLLTAQNNALRDNHYLFVMREYWRHESELGRHYATHFDSLVWSLTGEIMLRWNLIADQIPFAIGYGIETVWQLFAADQMALSVPAHQYQVAQVVNPNTKKDGGMQGQNGRCYDATMYRQLNLMAWFLIKHGKPLTQLTAEDYRIINTRLSQTDKTIILPDHEDHGLPYLVQLQSDLFIPPLAMLASEGCLRV